MLWSLDNSLGDKKISGLFKVQDHVIFRVVGEEQEGWVKVQRISIGGTAGSGQLMSPQEEEGEEGYIPIAFTEPV